MKYSFFILIAFGFILSSCVKEDPVLGLTITPSATSVDAGQPIEFDIQGDADFLVFYSGLEGSRFEDYPNANTREVNMLADEPSLSFIYRNFNGTVNAVFVATSHGNWGTDTEEQIFEFTIDISDNNINISSATLKTPGLFGKVFEGVVSTEDHTVTVNIPEADATDSQLAALTTNIVLSSQLSTLRYNGEVFQNNSPVDFSSGSQTFNVEAVGGAVQEWSIVVQR
ncbi:MAG: DUF5017 domain-containing protein [Phaeodactylibacter sp.]|uniref:DUF5017 domain-containing protein n=1 Tax=Phaeodactylibacter sp. TaxID=1940289 RepID=UPI0032EF9E10